MMNEAANDPATLTVEMIIRMEADLVKAIGKSDIAVLKNMLHASLLFLSPTGDVVTKESDLESHQSGGMIVEKLIPHIRNIKITADTATVIVDYDCKGAMLGNPVEGIFRYVRVWKMIDNSPQVIAGACIQLP
jgi:hypothetical protein